MEHDRFHVPYLSDKIPEAGFHGQAVKTVAYLRVSTAQQDVGSERLAILEYAFFRPAPLSVESLEGRAVYRARG